MPPTPDLGSKTTIAFQTSALTNVDGSETFFILGASVNGVSRAVIPTSHLGTKVANTFLPSDRYDGGELNLTMQMDRDAWKVLLADIYGTGSVAPTSGNSEVVTIVLGGVTTPQVEDMTFAAFVTNTDFDFPDEELMTCEMTFKVTGNIEFPTVAG